MVDVYSKKISDHVPELKKEGIHYVVAAASGGVGIQYATVVQAGAAPFSVVFADIGLSDMADDDYVAFAQGPNGDERVDQSTRATTGFDVLGGADTETLMIAVIGRLKNQAR